LRRSRPLLCMTLSTAPSIRARGDDLSLRWKSARAFLEAA
jgi:hypothetical protein